MNQTTSVEHFPCRTCGSTLTYEPGADTLDCPWCGDQNRLERETRPVRTHALGSGLSADDPLDLHQRLHVSCPSCGAGAELEPQVFATSCDFCATVIVAPSDTMRRFAPEAMLPFGVNQTQAQERLKKWLNSLWFAPSKLTRMAELKNGLDGVYVPYWAFDAKTRTAYTGKRGTERRTTKWVTVIKDGKTTRQARTVSVMRWRAVSGQVSRHFEDVLIEADGGIEQLGHERFRSWDIGAVEPFTEAFLAGYQARLYGTGLAQGWRSAERSMEKQIRHDIKRDIGGDDQRINAMEVQKSGEAFKLLLLPIWFSEYRYGSKRFSVAINGRTGEVRGQRPIAWWKVILTALFVLILVGAGLTLAIMTDIISLGPPI